MNETQIAERVARKVMAAGPLIWKIESVTYRGLKLSLTMDLGTNISWIKMTEADEDMQEQSRRELRQMVMVGLKIDQAKWGDRMVLGGGKIKFFETVEAEFLESGSLTYDDVEEILTGGGWL